MISNAFWPDSFLPVKRMVEDGDVCITKYVSLIGVIIHSSLSENFVVLNLKYSIILSNDINKQVNAAIDASCSMAAPPPYTNFNWPNV